MLAWLERNAVLVALLVFLAIVWQKVRGFFGVKSQQQTANLAVHTSHLQRPAKLRDGAPAAEQKAYAAEMNIYKAALAADKLASLTQKKEFLWFWERNEQFTNMIDTIIETKTPLSLIESEYKLVLPDNNLLDDLKFNLTDSEYRRFSTKVTRQ